MKKDSKKRFQVNEVLVDADAVSALPFFDRAVKATGHKDPDIVREAWQQRPDHRYSRDFLRYIQEFQNPPK